MEPAASSSIPIIVLRQSKFNLVIAVLWILLGVVRLVTLDPSLGFREWFVAGASFLGGSGLLLSYLTHSITVNPEVMVMRRWFDVQTIRTDDFVSIERNGSWTSRTDMVVSRHASLRAPWYHPKLSAAVQEARNEVRAAT